MIACRRPWMAVATFALFLVAAPYASADPQGFIYLESDAGDYIGGGRIYYRDSDNGRFATPQLSDRDGDGLIDYVFFLWEGDLGEFVFLQFGTNQLPGTNLEPDFYDDAQRAPFAAPGHPGLDISMDGRGCNILTGNFTIMDAEFDYSVSPPHLVSFAVSFEQHCEGLDPALFGIFLYNDPIN